MKRQSTSLFALSLAMVPAFVSLNSCAYYAQEESFLTDSGVMGILGALLVGAAEGFFIWAPIAMIALFPLGYLLLKLRIRSLEGKMAGPFDRFRIAAVQQEAKPSLYPKTFLIILGIGLAGTFLFQRDGSPGQWNLPAFFTEVIPAWFIAFFTGKNLLVTVAGAITTGGFVYTNYSSLWRPSEKAQQKCQTDSRFAALIDDDVRLEIMEKSPFSSVRKQALKDYGEKTDFLKLMNEPKYAELRSSMIEQLHSVCSLDQLAPHLTASEIRDSSQWQALSFEEQKGWLRRNEKKLPQAVELKKLWKNDNEEDDFSGFEEDAEEIRTTEDVKERYALASLMEHSFDFTIPGGYTITFLGTEHETKELGVFGSGQSGPIQAEMHYIIYSARNEKEARAFLDTQIVQHEFYYVLVETPDGNFGIDINGIYEE